jgi:hypothetical protein
MRWVDLMMKMQMKQLDKIAAEVDEDEDEADCFALACDGCHRDNFCYCCMFHDDSQWCDCFYHC